MIRIDLKPIKIPTLEWQQIEEEIKKVFREEIYLPLLKQFHGSEGVFRNARDGLIEALQKGKITFSQGIFSGSFNASISKELRKLGAVWDRSKRVYKLPMKDLPYEIRTAIAVSESHFEAKMAAIDKKLDAIVPEALIGKIKIGKFFDKSLWKVQKSFEESVKRITVAPQLSESSAENLQKEWRDNINLSIKGIADEILPKLRKEMQENIYKGNRYGAMVDTLQKSYGLSASRAKYVARNETNLFMAKFKQERLAEVGVYKYRWQSVIGTIEHPVRPVHKDLTERSKQGEIFDFRHPPVAEASGERYNPHERNNCFPGSTLVRLDQRIFKIFRRRYAGKMTLLVAENDIIHKSTPNHPVLTNRGWIAAQDVQIGDYLFQGRFENIERTKMNIENMEARFQDVFDAIAATIKITSSPITHTDFHGDVSEKNHVDIINIDRDLIFDGIAKTYKIIEEFLFQSSNLKISVGSSLEQTLSAWRVSSESLISFMDELSFFLNRHGLESQEISLRTGTFGNIQLSQPFRKSSSRDSVFFGDREFAHPFLVILNRIMIQWTDIPSNTSSYFSDFNSTSAELLAEQIGKQSDFRGYFSQTQLSRFIKPLRIVDKSFRDFSSHVFNFETSTNWYYAKELIVSNCRCTAVPVYEKQALDSWHKDRKPFNREIA